MQQEKPDGVGQILIEAEAIQNRVAVLGQEISEDLAGKVPLLVAVLKGSVLFAADLFRAIGHPAEIDFMAVSSYGDATLSSGVVRIIKDLDVPIAGRDVILVEDIIDSGLTMSYLLDHLNGKGAKSLRTCSLLVREGRQAPDLQLDYAGFEIPPAFVIGYGLDAAQQYRNLPYVAIYEGELS